MRYSPILLVLVTGCSLYEPDEPADDTWPGYDLPVCATTRRAYRIDELRIPLNSSEGDDLGWDFDGDGTIDNQGANIMSSVYNAVGVDLAGAVQEALEADLVQIGVTIDTCADPDYALVSLVRGISLDRGFDPPRMLASSATTFASVAVGALPATATDGVAQFPVGQLIHPSVTDWIDADALVVDVVDVTDVGIEGRMMAALDGAAAYEVVTAAFQQKMIDRIDELGADDPVTMDMLELFDDDEDGAISLEEVRGNSLVMTLLRPDVDLDESGEEERLSVGVGFHAEPIELFVN